MNPIDYAVSYIKRYIEPEILAMVFKSDNGFTSIDDMIKMNVIYPIVMVDINMIGGERVIIRLEDTEVIENRDDGTIIRVPLELTDHRPILNVISVYDATRLAENSGFGAEQGRVSSFSSSRYKVLGKNVIYIKNLISTLYNYVMECNVMYDRNFSENKPENNKLFGELCLQACKNYIHKELNISLSKGSIYYGHDLSIIRSIIDDYSSAKDEYDRLVDERLDVMVFTNDDRRMDEYINLMLPDKF
jgi:hypothetical protein